MCSNYKLLLKNDFFFFFLLSSKTTHTLVYLCSEKLQGYSDSISGQMPPSCGQSSEPRQAAWSSTGTAWEPEPGSGLWTRVSPERRAEPWCWSHPCTTRKQSHTHPHVHTHTHTVNRTKKDQEQNSARFGSLSWQLKQLDEKWWIR